jgi:hypothetical protein
MTHQPRLVVAAVLSALALACQPQDNTGPRGGHGGSVGGSGGDGGGGGSNGGSGGGGSGGTAGRGGTGGGGTGGGGTGGGGTGGGGSLDAGKDVGGGGGDMGTTNSACKPDLPNSLFCNPTGKMPKTIKETGVFPMAPDLTKHDPAMREFAPSPELWSDGMTKLRFLLLPAGMKIDNTDGEGMWKFPVGTIFIKTFFDDSGAMGAPRAIETRFIRRVKAEGVATDYEYYVYQWHKDGMDADLLVDGANGVGGDVMKGTPVPIVINHMVNGQPLRINNGMPFMHTIPSQKNCIDCHEESGMVAQTFIGFDEIRLNSKKVTTATTTQLQDFSDIFMKPIPAAPKTITDNNALLLRVKRFVFGNCVHCHNGNSVFDMHPEVFVENTVGKEVEAQSVHPPPGYLRIVAGNPTMSVVYRQMARVNLPPAMNGADPLRPMPPVGVADIAVDQAALTDMRTWIMGLK